MDNHEIASFNQVMNDLSFTVLEHGYLHTGPEWKFLNLSSPFNRLYLTVSGGASIWTDCDRVMLEPGVAAHIPLNRRCNYVCEEQLVMFYVHFRLELLEGHDLFDGLSRLGQVNLPGGLAAEFIERALRRGTADVLWCKAQLMQLVAQFIDDSAPGIAEQMGLTAKYRQLYDYVRQNCSAALRVADLARHLGTTAHSLSAAFKRDTGQTLKHFFDARLIQRAQDRLLVSDQPIKAIAYELGFLDEFHFSRFFKKGTGMAPGRYRQRNNTFK